MKDIDNNTIKVGKYEPRVVSELNHTLFMIAKTTMDEATHLNHIGWSGVGDFIDYLEENYDIKIKEGK